jgi:hypothetical protein
MHLGPKTGMLHRDSSGRDAFGAQMLLIACAAPERGVPQTGAGALRRNVMEDPEWKANSLMS